MWISGVSMYSTSVHTIESFHAHQFVADPGLYPPLHLSPRQAGSAKVPPGSRRWAWLKSWTNESCRRARIRSQGSAGWFSPPLPDDPVFIEPHPRRVQPPRRREV